MTLKLQVSLSHLLLHTLQRTLFKTQMILKLCRALMMQISGWNTPEFRIQRMKRMLRLMGGEDSLTSHSQTQKRVKMKVMMTVKMIDF